MGDQLTRYELISHFPPADPHHSIALAVKKQSGKRKISEILDCNISGIELQNHNVVTKH